jgi:hypothetical protein
LKTPVGTEGTALGRIRPIIAVAVSLITAARAWAQGDPPIVTDPSWFTWYQGLLNQRLAECPLTRSTAVYFSQAGDDQTGDGSQPSPWKTLAKAQQVIDAAPSGGAALLFRRGDVWRETAGLNVDRPNVTVADYGTGEKPLFTAFQPIADALAWQPVAAQQNTYQRSQAAPVAWVKEDDDLDQPYSRQTSPAGVSAVEGSWYWDSAGVLYVHARGATDPRTDGKSYEYAPETQWGVVVQGDGAHIENIRAQGWGMSLTAVIQCHGIDCRVQNGDRAVFVGCESHYGLTHAMTHYAQAGGIATFVNCKAGLTAGWAGDGGTMFNTFATLGGNQTIYDHCMATHGTLPSSDFPPGQRSGMAFYGHTDTAIGDVLGLTITYGCTTRDTTYGCANPGGFSNLVPAADLRDVRCFMVGDLFEGGQGTGANFALGVANGARINGKYLNLHPPYLTSGSINVWAAGGWVMNCTLEVDATGQPGDLSLFRSPTTAPSKVQAWNCYFGILARPGQMFRFDGAIPSNSQGSGFVNCAIVATGGGVCRPNITPPSPLHAVRGEQPWALHSCAYFGVEGSSITPDTRAVVLGAPESRCDRLSCVSPLACAAGPLPGGIALRYDQSGASGVRDDIGPVEVFVCANCDQSTVEPVLNILDYVCFVNKFATGDPGANCDGSTSPPILNVADFLCFQTAFARGCK